MSFFVTDGSAIEIEDWKTMRNLAYRPKCEEYAPTKDIVISLGYLPMEINGQFHFYDFIEVADGVTAPIGRHSKRGLCLNLLYQGLSATVHKPR